MREQLLKRNIKLIYIRGVLGSMIFVAPVLVIFMQSRGLSFTQIMFLQSLFAFAGMFFEIPSGYFSDKLGRKKTIIIATIFLLFGNILFSFAYSMWQFIAMEITFAFGYAMLSGTVSSILYETLLELKQENRYTKIWGELNFYSLMSVAFASIVGSFVADYSMDFAVYLVNIPFSLSVILALFLVEPKVRKKLKRQTVREDFKEIGSFLKTNMTITLIIIFSAVVFMFNQSVFWLYQPYLGESGIAIVYNGIIFASFQVVAAYASKYSHIVKKKIGIKWLLLIIGLGSPISIVMMGFNIQTWGFLIIYAQQVTRSFKLVVVSQILHDSVESHFRATVDSIANFLAKIGFAVVLPFIGYFLDYNSLSTVLIYLGSVGFVSVGVILYFIVTKRSLPR